MNGPEVIQARPKGRRGRPRVPAPVERLSTRIPPAEYDRLARLARREGMSLSALVRQVILVVLRDFSS